MFYQINVNQKKHSTAVWLFKSPDWSPGNDVTLTTAFILLGRLFFRSHLIISVFSAQDMKCKRLLSKETLKRIDPQDVMSAAMSHLSYDAVRWVCVKSLRWNESVWSPSPAHQSTVCLAERRPLEDAKHFSAWRWSGSKKISTKFLIMSEKCDVMQM